MTYTVTFVLLIFYRLCLDTFCILVFSIGPTHPVTQSILPIPELFVHNRSRFQQEIQFLQGLVETDRANQCSKALHQCHIRFDGCGDAADQALQNSVLVEGDVLRIVDICGPSIARLFAEEVARN